MCATIEECEAVLQEVNERKRQSMQRINTVRGFMSRADVIKEIRLFEHSYKSMQQSIMLQVKKITPAWVPVDIDYIRYREIKRLADGSEYDPCTWKVFWTKFNAIIDSYIRDTSEYGMDRPEDLCKATAKQVWASGLPRTFLLDGFRQCTPWCVSTIKQHASELLAVQQQCALKPMEAAIACILLFRPVLGKDMAVLIAKYVWKSRSDWRIWGLRMR